VVIARITWYVGNDANPCYSSLVGKAYPVDLNALFGELEIRRTGYQIFSNDKPGVLVRVFDPIGNPGGDALSSSLDVTDPDVLANSVDVTVDVAWNQFVPEPPDGGRQLMYIATGILGGFFLFLFVLLAIWVYAKSQPEPVPLPDDKSLPDDDMMSVVSAAEREYAAGGYITGATVDPVTSSSWLKSRLSMKKRPQSASERDGRAPDDDELVDASILLWEKHFDELHQKHFFYNTKTGASTWRPPIPGRYYDH